MKMVIVVIAVVGVVVMAATHEIAVHRTKIVNERRTFMACFQLKTDY